MKDDKTVVSEKTLIPLSFLLIILVGVVRVESTAFQARANEKEIEKLHSTDKLIAEELKKHGEALARIEAILSKQNQLADK